MASMKSTKHPEDMTPAELARATRKFDQPYVFEKARPMTASQRAQERKLRRARPKNGHPPQRVSISLQKNLLKQADALAKKKGLNRSQLIANFVIAGLGHTTS